MAWADELVLSCIPWHNTSKMGADCVNTIGGKGFVLLHNEVSRVSLKCNNKFRLFVLDILLLDISGCIFVVFLFVLETEIDQ